MSGKERLEVSCREGGRRGVSETRVEKRGRVEASEGKEGERGGRSASTRVVVAVLNEKSTFDPLSALSPQGSKWARDAIEP